MQENLIAMLTNTNDRYACAYADKIITESQESDAWYAYFDNFVSLLKHPKSLVRNRAIHIIAANVRWDEQDRFEAVLPEYLSHISDEKPITVRQCVKALAQVGLFKPRHIPTILLSLKNADLTQYKDSMRPLIEKDIAGTVEKLSDML